MSEALYKALLYDPRYRFVVKSNGECVLSYFRDLWCVEVVPGSFNPLHKGHRWIYDNIRAATLMPKIFEISINRIGKDPLSYEELTDRVKQFGGYADVLVTNSSLMQAKAGVIPVPVRFHVGFDVAQRMFAMHDLPTIQGINANFVVYDRVIDGVIKSLSNYKYYPNNMQQNGGNPDLMEISSTLIRNGQI
jgi:hypothetical protein